MKNKPIIIRLSFKNTIDDIKLYNWIISHSNYSGFIKDIIRDYYLQLDNNSQEKSLSNKEQT